MCFTVSNYLCGHVNQCTGYEVTAHACLLMSQAFSQDFLSGGGGGGGGPLPNANVKNWTFLGPFLPNLTPPPATGVCQCEPIVKCDRKVC